MRETRFGLGRFALAGIVPAVILAACGSSTGSEHPGDGGTGAVAEEATGGSKTGSGSGGLIANSGSGAVSGGAAASGSGSGGSLNRAGSGGSSGNTAQAGTSGADGEPLACGSVTCGAAQYCVIPCCGGTAPACFPASSDGKCPAGSHSGCSTNPTACTSSSSCCQQDSCSPPPPFCSDAKPTMCFSSPGVPGPAQGRICQMMCA